MTEQEKKEQRKKTVKRVWDGSKLIMAIGALTAAINGYSELSKKSVALSQQNAILYKALSGKVNDMAERLAYIEGRIDGLSKIEAKEAVKDKIQEAPTRAPASLGFGGGAMEEPESAEAMSDEGESAAEGETEPMVAVEAPPKPASPPRSVQIKAYEQLPDNLEALMQNQQQVQEDM